MNENDKHALICDVCARLVYNTAYQDDSGDVIFINHENVHLENYFEGINQGIIKPMLKPMSSLLAAERAEMHNYMTSIEGQLLSVKDRCLFIVDWYLKNHYDLYDLIPRGLAVAVTEENDPYTDEWHKKLQ